jgi:acetyltransferase-like isoleucine patch superfamily enzyme
VLIKKGAHLHSSATVINKIVIGARARVGAGSVVIRDVDEGVTVVGNPARQI